MGELGGKSVFFNELFLYLLTFEQKFHRKILTQEMKV